MSEKLQLDDKLFELLPEAEKNSEFIAMESKTFLADARSFADHCSSFKERIANALRKTGLNLFSEMESYQIKIQWDGWTSKPEDVVIRIMLFYDAATDEELETIKNLLRIKDMVIETNEDYELEVCCMYNDNPFK